MGVQERKLEAKRLSLRSLAWQGFSASALVTIASWGVGWFPMDAGHWAVFLGIFLGIFLVMTAGYEIYFWAVGRRYDGILGQYRRSKERQ